MVIDIRLGKDSQLAKTHKADALVWTYAEGQLSQNADGLVRTLSPMDTLALANLLRQNYEEIVTYARKEQRKGERDRDCHLWGNDRKNKLR